MACCLTGGDDVAPTRYGEEKHPAVKAVAPERDEFEIALVREARKRDLPILAICRGIQVLNVAAGGSLVQDIPTQVTGALEHKQTVPPHQPYDLAHEVWLEKDSLLAKLMRERLSDADSCEVNSRHHQSVKTLAPGFQVERHRSRRRRSKRSRIRRRGSVSAFSGTRKISGAPANFDRSSKASWKRRTQLRRRHARSAASASAETPSRRQAASSAKPAGPPRGQA